MCDSAPTTTLDNVHEPHFVRCGSVETWSSDPAYTLNDDHSRLIPHNSCTKQNLIGQCKPISFAIDHSLRLVLRADCNVFDHLGWNSFFDVILVAHIQLYDVQMLFRDNLL
eukprot:749322_1